MAHSTIKLSVRVAWWVHWYVYAVLFFAHLTGRHPDADKLSRVIGRGLTAEVEASKDI